MQNPETRSFNTPEEDELSFLSNVEFKELINDSVSVYNDTFGPAAVDLKDASSVVDGFDIDSIRFYSEDKYEEEVLPVVMKYVTSYNKIRKAQKGVMVNYRKITALVEERSDFFTDDKYKQKIRNLADQIEFMESVLNRADKMREKVVSIFDVVPHSLLYRWGYRAGEFAGWIYKKIPDGIKRWAFNTAVEISLWVYGNTPEFVKKHVVVPLQKEIFNQLSKPASDKEK